MKYFGVKDVSKLSGVSVRTLHYYDRIGLLKPSKRTEAGYRYYGEVELLRLQQILFYKELDFSLKEIAEVLDDPGFNLIEALEKHKTALRSRQTRITQLLSTIDDTIHHLKNGQKMENPEMLYEGLPKEVGTTYRKEAIEKYGKVAIEQAENALMQLGKENFEQLKTEFEQMNRALFNLHATAPESEAVQQLIQRHYAAIRAFWGTSNTPDKQAEDYAGLGQLYVDDPRFTTIDGQAQPEFALFLKKAMQYFVDSAL